MSLPFRVSFYIMPRLSVPLTDEQHTAIKIKAAQAGLPQAEVARRLLLAWLYDDIENNQWVQRLIVAFAKLDIDSKDEEALASIGYVARELSVFVADRLEPGEWDYQAAGFSVEHWNKE